ncbi:metal-dependent hydrolase [Bacillus sp. AK128]
MKVSYHGHSVVKVEANGKTILFDPFINGNGLTDLVADEVTADVILLTHGHNDHVGDTISIAKRNDALVIAPNELAGLLGKRGLRVHPMHIGGAYQFDFGKVKLTQAFHGSAYEEDGQVYYTGMPSGMLLTIDGKTIFHAGDTALFSDMKLIGDLNQIDLAFLPIGDNFTMGPEDAVLAAKWIKAKKVVPIHYNTFPVIEQNPDSYVQQLDEGVGQVLQPGEVIEL